MTIKMTVKFPFVKSFNAYDKISSYRRYLQYNNDNIIITSKVIGFDGKYWSCFWINGRKPNLNQVNKLMENENYNPYNKLIIWR